MTTPLYLSIVDRQLEAFIPEQDRLAEFEETLLLNLLFQPSILLPDIFLFISDAIEKHVLGSHRKSLLETAIEEGLVVLSFRDRRVGSFSDSLKLIHGDQGRVRIQGTRLRAAELATRLDVAIGSHGQRVAWPDPDPAQVYEERLTSFLSKPEPPSVHSLFGVAESDLHDYWSLTKRWRIDAVGEARRITQRSHAGLRRGEVMNAVARSLGMPKESRVDDVSDLLPLAKSERERWALRYFLRWMTECYHLAHIAAFECLGGLPLFQPLESLALLDEMPFGTRPEFSERLMLEVHIPRLASLRQISSADLISIRKREGVEYFAHLSSWMEAPSERSAQAVRDALEAYTRALKFCAAQQNTADRAILSVMHSHGIPTSQESIAAAFKLLSFMPYAKELLSISKGIYSLYAYRGTEKRRILIPGPKRLRMNCPAPGGAGSGPEQVKRRSPTDNKRATS